MAFIIHVFAGIRLGVAGLIVHGDDIRAGCTGAGVIDHQPSGTVHHSDKGSQYVSLAYTQRLKEAGLLASTGSTGDWSVTTRWRRASNGLYKAEVIHRRAGKTVQKWNWPHSRGRAGCQPEQLLERLGHTPPAEAEKAYYASIGNDDLAA